MTNVTPRPLPNDKCFIVLFGEPPALAAGPLLSGFFAEELAAAARASGEAAQVVPACSSSAALSFYRHVAVSTPDPSEPAKGGK